MGTFCKFYHFRDLTKMIIDIDTLCFARLHSSSDGHGKIFPSRISKNVLQLSGVPYFNIFAIISGNVSLYFVKCALVSIDLLNVHIRYFLLITRVMQ